ncbi:LysR family transcriptional regulator [Ferrimonas marina]|uniref:DNA-binding transcriptional regulator, LysR family n=1 Tax=Ferrimonas marina TaxID=299255 RepID=A0A1M5RJ34_9GAMM|nr:LysR family transcriptional regulator [Ferrimonas marina]SHH26285.1 DNA-binding transcriptional regulator, LysR family [Ferrimonas marina]
MPTVKALAQLDLNLLKVVEALYQHQSMTGAAQQLNLTPSAVSHAMKRLRQVLGDPLFVRQGQRMVPTPVCRRMLPELLRSLTQLRQALQRLGSFDPTQAQQVIRLAIHDALEPLFLPRLVARFQAQAPGLQLHSVALEREQLTKKLDRGEVDFAIDVARALSRPVCHSPLASSPYCVLAGKAHWPQPELSAEQYGAARHITVSNRPTGKVLEDLAFAQQGFERNIAIRCQSYHSARAIIVSQPLLLTLPRSLAQGLMDDDLVMLPLPFAVPEVQTHLYWHEHGQDDSLLQWMRERILAEV